MPKRKRPYPTKSDRSQTNPRSLNQQQRTLIALYSHCQLGMTPQQFYTKWQVTHQELASTCYRSLSTVGCWFTNGRNHRRPTPNDLRHLALMDFLQSISRRFPNHSSKCCVPQSKRLARVTGRVGNAHLIY